MSLKVNMATLLKVLLYVIVIGCENCFYLVNADAINISGVLNYTDIFVLLAMLFCVLVYTQVGYLTTERLHFKWVIIGVIVLSIISSIQSYLLYGQSFTTGLRPQRFWIIWGLLYFPLRQLLAQKIFDVDDIIKLIFVVGTIEIVLYTAQYLAGSSFTFLYVGTNTRYGETRYYFNHIFIRLLLFLNLDRVFNRKKIVSSIFYIAAILFVLLFVGKMRMTSMATLLTIMIGILIWRRGGSTKAGILILACIAAFGLFNTAIVQDTITEVNSALDGSVSSGSTLQIRDAAHELYLEQLAEHPIVGCGFISSLNYNASKAAGLYNSILLVDNGFWAFIYMYGGLGAIWVIYTFGAILKNSWQISRNKGVYFVFLTPLAWLIAGQTELHWYWDNGFICLTFILVILEEYMYNDRGELSSVIQDSDQDEGHDTDIVFANKL